MLYESSNDEVILDQSQNGNLSGNYIARVICNILGYSNHCFVLTEMKSFKNLEPEMYENMILLSNYDVVEPIVAKSIEEEYETTHDKNTWVQIYNVFLSETASLIAVQKYHEAIGKYHKMIEVLKDYFGIMDVEVVLDDLKLDVKTKECSSAKMKLPIEKSW